MTMYDALQNRIFILALAVGLSTIPVRELDQSYDRSNVTSECANPLDAVQALRWHAALTEIGATTASEPATAAEKKEEPMEKADRLQELAERLLSYPMGIDGRPQVAGLVPGRVADGLPLDLPLPPGAEVIGTLVRRHVGQELASAEVVLDASGPAEAILDVYRHALPPQGWAELPPAQVRLGFMFMGGFTPPQRVVGVTFCRGRPGPSVSIGVTPTTGGPNDVRVRVDLTSAGPCAQQRHPGFPETPPVPPLEGPPGVPVTMRGGGGSGSQWTSGALAETTMTVGELAEHYAAQLRAAGWIETGHGAAGTVAWYTWRVPRDGEEQHGLLLVIDVGERRRRLSVQVETLPPATGGWLATDIRRSDG
jgi:hypothetical protein